MSDHGTDDTAVNADARSPRCLADQDASDEDGPLLPASAASRRFVYVMTAFSAIGGFLFGYDTGVVSGAMILLRKQFKLTSLWQELVVSVTIGAAAIFAFVSGLVNERFGRKPAVLIGSFVFLVGAVVLGLATSKAMLLVGRFIVGVGIGFASMTVPVYIAESAPVELRGRLVTVNNVFITGGQFTAALVDGAFSHDTLNGWRYMLGLAGLPALVQFVGFVFLPETPRWLVSQGRDLDAVRVLQRLRESARVDQEFQQIRQSYLTDKQSQVDRGSRWIIVDMLATPHVRRALIVGCSLQLFQQICGINTVMYYSATIIKMSGVSSDSAAIWLSALTAAVNFAFTFVGLYLVEKIGRRPLTLCSLAGTFTSLVLLAVSFQLTSIMSPSVNWSETEDFCSNHTSCASCLTSPHCGFCSSTMPPLNTSCLTAFNESTSSVGRCAMHSDTVTWHYKECPPSSLAWLATLSLALYLAFFAPGMGPMPWTINSEIYPMWARSAGTSLSTMVNWIFNLLISLTFLTLTEALTKYGAFWLYSSFALIGFLFLFKVLPETKGKSLEEIQDVFMKPWC